jgi:diguanylate cyclase (GGDEF)-like protein
MYRLGGEEFLVVLPGVDAAGGATIAERLRAAVEAALPGGLNITVSAGVAAAQGASVDYDDLFAAADAALYRAKDAGRNRVEAAPRFEREHDSVAVELEPVPV